jgi:hypothetical protein
VRQNDDANCDDEKPCTRDMCTSGNCLHVPVGEGECCYLNGVEGVCDRHDQCIVKEESESDDEPNSERQSKWSRQSEDDKESSSSSSSSSHHEPECRRDEDCTEHNDCSYGLCRRGYCNYRALRGEHECQLQEGERGFDDPCYHGYCVLRECVSLYSPERCPDSSSSSSSSSESGEQKHAKISSADNSDQWVEERERPKSSSRRSHRHHEEKRGCGNGRVEDDEDCDGPDRDGFFEECVHCRMHVRAGGVIAFIAILLGALIACCLCVRWRNGSLGGRQRRGRA